MLPQGKRKNKISQEDDKKRTVGASVARPVRTTFELLHTTPDFAAERLRRTCNVFVVVELLEERL